MADKGQKGTDKLSEALRRAEEAVLKEEKGVDENLKEKGLDLDDVVPKDDPKKKLIREQINLPKENSGPRMVDLSKKKKNKPKPKPEPKKSKDGKLPASLSFGMLDLGGGSSGAPELELATGEEKAAMKPAAKAPAPRAPSPKPPPAEPPEAKPAEQKRPRRRKDSDEYVPYVPRRSYARQIKIALIVLLVLGAIGGGVFGFLKWRESVDAEKAALKEQINSASRESLMDDKIKKEKFK